MRNSITLALILITSGALFGQAESIDNAGYYHEINIEDKVFSDVYDCISEMPLLMGLESQTEALDHESDSAFFRGSYSYTCYIDDYDTFAGEVVFKYEYILRHDKLECRFYDLEHIPSNSKLKPVGMLPKHWNDKVGKTFSKADYNRILTNMNVNFRLWVKNVTKYCLN